MTGGKVLLIDSDPRVQEQVGRACAQIEASLRYVSGLDEGMAVIEAEAPQVVLLDVEQPEAGGFEGFGRLRDRWPRLCAILIAERARSDQAIEAMKRGAIDYLLKPLNHEDLVARLSNTLRIARDMTVPAVYEEAEPAERHDTVDHIIGQSPAMHEVFKLIGLMAPRDVNVLISGESGTGKELVAKALYHHSRRKDRPFLAVNCAAIPETLLESELFGHEKGAFTGADVRRIGKFEQCDGGTLFLDEIGDLPLNTQAKLLRVLQDGSFQRLGGLDTIRCDVRIIAASNHPLQEMIRDRTFREDLYYRLKVASIELPPLRDREVDAVLLAHYFVKRYNAEMGTHIQRFSPTVLPALLAYPWPGNVRELGNVIKASLVVARGRVFQIEFMPEHIRSAARPAPPVSASPSPSPAGLAGREELRELCRDLLKHDSLHGQLYRQAVEAAEREVIATCLEEAGGRVAPAARLLGITRTTLRRKMTELGIQVSTLIARPDVDEHSG